MEEGPSEDRALIELAQVQMDGHKSRQGCDSACRGGAEGTGDPESGSAMHRFKKFDVRLDELDLG